MRLWQSPLLDYAARVWRRHCQAIELKSEDKKIILPFLESNYAPNGGAFNSWVQALLLNTDLSTVQQTSPPCYAPSYNISSIIKTLIRSNPNVGINQRGGRFSSTPLAAAVERGHLEATELLVEMGAVPGKIRASFQDGRTKTKMHGNEREKFWDKSEDLASQAFAHETAAVRDMARIFIWNTAAHLSSATGRRSVIFPIQVNLRPARLRMGMWEAKRHRAHDVDVQTGTVMMAW
ncbi:ankyrin repeat protein [Zalerion maritima]|uniref:Ankyrin repeat protein n=1 Tax=Zalerion maritima TaxID=339359 RepID=A0AAD5S0G6_9PEZI|nr:ankyrin repeat protein [Zalerion maritima]